MCKQSSFGEPVKGVEDVAGVLVVTQATEEKHCAHHTERPMASRPAILYCCSPDGK